MTKIKILPPSLVGKIAAGEVIDRPASALKEIIENSIDAKAKNIQVYIKQYGISSIKVVDDGEGIPSEDIVLAFHRHATSKIEKEEDLYNISTLGFRGEALYSIAQVSKLRITTQYREDTVGRELLLIGGEIKEQKPAHTKGTTVEVRELFYNAPVRRKFLRSPATEKAHIIETVQNYALAYPEISFYLNIDGEEILVLPKADSFLTRISQIFSSSFAEKLIHKTLSEGEYKIELFLGTNELARRNRTKQFIFINKRPVRDSLVVGSLYKAFQIKESHPQFILYITMPPQEVDFNVHPAKKEVRFRNPAVVVDLITKSAQSERKTYSVSEALAEWTISDRTTLTYSQQSLLAEVSTFQEDRLGNFLNLGNAIIVLEQPEGILFLDYHGAHERVNFEKLLEGRHENINRLIFPLVIELNAQYYTLLSKNLKIINELGIEAEDFGKNSIIVRAIPDFLKTADMVSILESIAVLLKEETGIPDLTDIKKKVAATVACHKSLRANDRINSYEVKILLDQLERTSDPDHCPHGRPIKKFLPIQDIKKWFSR